MWHHLFPFVWLYFIPPIHTSKLTFDTTSTHLSLIFLIIVFWIMFFPARVKLPYYYNSRILLIISYVEAILYWYWFTVTSGSYLPIILYLTSLVITEGVQTSFPRIYHLDDDESQQLCLSRIIFQAGIATFLLFVNLNHLVTLAALHFFLSDYLYSNNTLF